MDRSTVPPPPGLADAPELRDELITHTPPEAVFTTRRYDKRMYVAGQGAAQPEVMFVATSVGDEEASESMPGMFGQKLTQKPRYLRGPAGCILKDLLASTGIDIDHQYYTALVKYLIPKGERMRPKKPDIDNCIPILHEEITRLKPKIIVTFGKPAFEAVYGERMRFDQLEACWMYSERFDCKIFVMPDVFLPVVKPHLYEGWRVNFLDLSLMLDEMRGITTNARPVFDMAVINTAAELREFVEVMKRDVSYLLSVDCEWGGTNYIDVKVRSLQVCWKRGHSRYIRFMDDKGNYVFDVSYAEAGAILAAHLNRPIVKFVGAHISADLPVMHHHLGIEWYNKTAFDTEFAEQAINENGTHGLERIALKYTRFGRYDVDLVLWKNANKALVDDANGYLYVPDDILIPYALKDVLVPMEAMPQMIERMKADNVWDFYVQYVNQAIGDMFVQFTLAGLPVNVPKMDRMRELYSYARVLLEKELVADITRESRTLLLRELMMIAPGDGYRVFSEISTAVAAGRVEDARTAFKIFVGPTRIAELLPFFDHFIAAPTFGLRSSPDKCRWLFDVRRFEPVKSTGSKEKGMPSIPWSRVKNLPPEIRKLYKPAADKQTIKMLADDSGDELLNHFLDVLAVGNVCKAFLKPAEVDEDGELVRENGLHYWLASDGKIHGMMSMTETWRPRAWRPNSLNWPSYTHEGIKRGVVRVLSKQKELGLLPAAFEQYLDPKKIPSIRSVIDVSTLPPLPGSLGWCFVESDFVTAEIRGLAFISGDESLIRLVCEADEQFGIPKDPKLGKLRVRLKYADDCGIPEANRDPQFLMTATEEGKCKGTFAIEDLLHDENGKLVHPPHDLHWSLVEWVQEAPREWFSAKVTRTGIGKVGNFSCLSRATKVLTQCGNVSILDADYEKHQLWDGVEWVRFDGIIEKPPQELITYGGLTATVDHGVWTDDGREIFFGEAALQGLRLSHTQDSAGAPAECRFGGVCAGVVTSDIRSVDTLLSVQEHITESHVLGDACANHHLRLQQSSRDSDVALEVRCNEAALRDVDAREQLQLQGTGDQGSVPRQDAFCDVGLGKVAERDIQGEGFRSPGERRTLRAGQSTAGGSSDESGEHANVYPIIRSKDPRLRSGTPRGAVEVSHRPKSSVLGNDRGRDHSSVGVEKVAQYEVDPRRLAEHESIRVPCQAPGGEAVSALHSEADPAGQGDGDATAASVGRVGEESQRHEHLSSGASVYGRASRGGLPDGDGGKSTAPQEVDGGSDRRALESELQEPEEWESVAAGSEIHDGASGSQTGGLDSQAEHGRRNVGESDSPILGVNGYRGRPKNILLAELRARGFVIEVEPVYDLVNAGPRHRFTANGVLVSNTMYGATANTLERKIKADTGKTPEEGTGMRIIDALAKRQPIATAFLEAMALVPETHGVWVAESGAKRRFVGHQSNVRGLDSRIIKSILSDLGRQSRNFPMQHSVAATAIRSVCPLLKHTRTVGMHARPAICLYDSVVSLTPLEERFEMLRLHDRFMTKDNLWHDHGRTWAYSSEHELNLAWSTTPDDETQAKLADVNWASAYTVPA